MEKHLQFPTTTVVKKFASIFHISFSLSVVICIIFLSHFHLFIICMVIHPSQCPHCRFRSIQCCRSCGRCSCYLLCPHLDSSAPLLRFLVAWLSTLLYSCCRSFMCPVTTTISSCSTPFFTASRHALCNSRGSAIPQHSIFTSREAPLYHVMHYSKLLLTTLLLSPISGLLQHQISTSSSHKTLCILANSS